MKKFIISLLIFVPFLTGCTNIDTQITINNDKSASVASSLTYEGNLADTGDVNALSVIENYKQFLDPMFKVENAYNKKLSTITAMKKVKNIEIEDLDLSSLGFKSNLKSGKFVEVKKNLLVTSYNIDLAYDLKKQIAGIKKAEKKQQLTSDKGLTPEYYQKYGELSELEPNAGSREDFLSNLDETTKYFTEEILNETIRDEQSSGNDLKVSFSVKTPGFASFNNADSVSGNLYSWDIDKDSVTRIKLQYVDYRGWAILIVLLIFIALLILLARKIVKHDAQKRADSGNNIV